MHVRKRQEEEGTMNISLTSRKAELSRYGAIFFRKRNYEMKCSCMRLNALHIGLRSLCTWIKALTFNLHNIACDAEMLDMTCEGKSLPLDVSVSQIVNRVALHGTQER